MGVMNKDRVNIVITNHVLRYSYHKNASFDRVIDQGEIPLPHETIKDGNIVDKTTLRNILIDFVQQKKWKRKNICFCLPDDSVVIRQLQIPAGLTKSEALGYVQTQLGHSFYLPFANPALEIEFLDINNHERSILLYAYPKDKIDAFAELFRESGLRPIVADLTSLSVYRYFYKQSELNKDHILHVHWNWDALVLTAFHHHKAVFTRYIKVEMMEHRNDLSDETIEQTINEYSVEINRIIDFYKYSISKGQADINLILLTGDFPYLQQVKNTLSQSLSTEIHPFTDEVDDLKYIDVLGLALKEGI
jgi:type IV pilus assembly protein PilM